MKLEREMNRERKCSRWQTQNPLEIVLTNQKKKMDKRQKIHLIFCSFFSKIEEKIFP